MPKHLYNLPHGSSLPSTSGLEDGYPYLLDDGNVRVLYENYAGVWQAVTGTRQTNARTASYTLVLLDAGKVVEMNSASATVLTVPDNATVAFPIGSVIEVTRIGAGTVTVTPASGVTVNSSGSLVTVSTQFAVAYLRKRATDTWLLYGALA